MEEHRTETWNFKANLGQSIAVDAARRLSLPQLVLPFIYIAAGAPVMFAVLLLPIAEITRLVGYVGAARVIHRAKRRKWHLMLCLLVVGAWLALVGMDAT